MNNGNYIGRRAEGGDGGGAEAAGSSVKEDDHAHEAALGFPLHTDGPDRLGWLMNMNQVGPLGLHAGSSTASCCMAASRVAGRFPAVARRVCSQSFLMAKCRSRA